MVGVRGSGEAKGSGRTGIPDVTRDENSGGMVDDIGGGGVETRAFNRPAGPILPLPFIEDEAEKLLLLPVLQEDERGENDNGEETVPYRPSKSL